MGLVKKIKAKLCGAPDNNTSQHTDAPISQEVEGRGAYAKPLEPRSMGQAASTEQAGAGIVGHGAEEARAASAQDVPTEEPRRAESTIAHQGSSESRVGEAGKGELTKAEQALAAEERPEYRAEAALATAESENPFKREDDTGAPSSLGRLSRGDESGGGDVTRVETEPVVRERVHVQTEHIDHTVRQQIIEKTLVNQIIQPITVKEQLPATHTDIDEGTEIVAEHGTAPDMSIVHDAGLASKLKMMTLETGGSTTTTTTSEGIERVVHTREYDQIIPVLERDLAAAGLQTEGYTTTTTSTSSYGQGDNTSYSTSGSSSSQRDTYKEQNPATATGYEKQPSSGLTEGSGSGGKQEFFDTRTPIEGVAPTATVDADNRLA